VTFGSKRRASLHCSPILGHTASFMHPPVRPLVLSPTICRYFAPPTLHRPFRLPTYSASRRSSTLAFRYNFRHYLLNLLSYFGLAFVLPTYGINRPDIPNWARHSQPITVPNAFLSALSQASQIQPCRFRA